MLSDLRQMGTDDIVLELSKIIYARAVEREFPDGLIETLRQMVDELEYRLVITPIMEIADAELSTGH